MPADPAIVDKGRREELARRGPSKDIVCDVCRLEVGEKRTERWVRRWKFRRCQDDRTHGIPSQGGA